MEQGNLESLMLLALGGVLALAGAVRLVYDERHGFRGLRELGSSAALPGSPRAMLAWGIVFGLIAAHFALGMQMIELRGLSHVEAYVPGLDLVPGISEPPRRIALLETVQWHWHSEPHPPGYFVLMWAWTKVFGTSLTAIRLPSLLLGCISILIAFLVGSRALRSRWGGVLAAFLIASNGHHLHWALKARPYELAMALGLASTWLWLHVSTADRSNSASPVDGNADSATRPDSTIDLLYVGTVVLGLYVHVLFWAFLASQMLYSVVSRRPGQSFASRALYFQTLCVVLASPMISHALYVGRRVQSGGEPSLAFTQDFLTFGFLFQYDPYAAADVPFLFELSLTALALLCLGLFLRDRSMRGDFRVETGSRPPTRSLLLMTAGMTAIILALAQEAWRQNDVVRATALFPIAATVAFAILARIRVPSGWPKNGLAGGVSPLPVLAFGTLLLTYAISLSQPAAVSRALLVAVPPLLIVLAGGLLALIRSKRAIGVASLVLVGVASAYSIVWYREYANVRDYRGLAVQLVAAMEESDVVFVRNRDWLTTPLFYHLPEEHDRLVADGYQERSSEVEGVWVIEFKDRSVQAPILEALEEFSAVESVEELGVRAIRYQRNAESED